MMILDDYLAKFAELKGLYEMVQQEFSSKGLVHHNWHHVLRDLARGIIIGEAEGAKMKIVLAGILLHDIGRLHPSAGEDHYTAGAEVAPTYLRGAGFTAEEIEEIVHCVKAHGPRAPEEPRTLEARVVYDVDVHSCAVGKIGVARVFDYFMREEGLGVKELLALPSGRKGPREDFYTETGRRLGEEGLKRASEFWEGLREELEEEEQAIRGVIPEYEGD
ncbi:MAG: HD domain-containing protein [Candidatus Bipolaricaulia bacterium]